MRSAPPRGTRRERAAASRRSRRCRPRTRPRGRHRPRARATRGSAAAGRACSKRRWRRQPAVRVRPARAATLPGAHMLRDVRIGLTADVLAASPQTGHGKVWHEVVRRLADQAALCWFGTGLTGRMKRVLQPVDVWLANGHAGERTERAPVVAQVHEVGGLTEEVRRHAPDDFMAMMAPLTEAGVRSATRVITPSESARAEVIEAFGYPVDHVVAVPHGVD